MLGNTLSDVTVQLDRCIKEFNIAYEQHKVHQAGTLLTNLKIVNKFNVGDRIYGMTVDSVRERLVVRIWDPTHRNMTQLENVNINGHDKTTYIESCTTHT